MVRQDSELLAESIADMYWNRQHTIAEIAEHFGVSLSCVRRWMDNLGIPRRSQRAAQQVATQRHGHPAPKMAGLSGPDNPNWKGGFVRHAKGYILRYAPWHPDQVNGYVFEHRLVAEQTVGRRLNPWEDVHHIDGDKANNDPGNLQVISHSDHTRLHQYSRRMRTRVPA